MKELKLFWIPAIIFTVISVLLWSMWIIGVFVRLVIDMWYVLPILFGLFAIKWWIMCFIEYRKIKKEK